MIIYGSSMSPFVRKALAFAAEKGVAVESLPGGMGGGSPAFKAASPFGKIPALEDGDFTLADSSAIVAYLEALAPEPNLIPLDAKARAKAIWFDEYADTILAGAVGPMFFNRLVMPKFMKKPGDEAAAANAEANLLPAAVAYLETVIPASGFLLEDRLTLADIAVASPFVNLMHLGWSPDPAAHPKVAAYVAAIHARPSFAKYIAAEKAVVGG
jgi:glutathione S-transferase